jgi:hypothetical protein
MDGPLEDTVPASCPITTRDLLTFTFGFGMVGEMFASPQPGPIVAAADELRLAMIGLAMWPAVQHDPDTWIAGLGSLPLLAQPGERWRSLGIGRARPLGQVSAGSGHTIGEVGWPWVRPPHSGSGPCCYRLDVAGSVPCSCAS